MTGLSLVVLLLCMAAQAGGPVVSAAGFADGRGLVVLQEIAFPANGQGLFRGVPPAGGERHDGDGDDTPGWCVGRPSTVAVASETGLILPSAFHGAPWYRSPSRETHAARAPPAA